MTRRAVMGAVVATAVAGVVLAQFVSLVRLPVTTATGVWVVGGLVAGVPGALGAALGAALIDLARGTVGWETLVRALAAMVAASVPYALRRRALGDDPRIRSVRDVLGLEGAVLVGAVGSAATLAWGGELLGTAPFLVAPRTLVAVAVAPLVLTPLAFAYATRFEFDLDVAVRVSPVRPLRDAVWATVLTVVVVAWFVLGLVGSLGFRAFETVAQTSPQQFADRGLGFLLAFDSPLLGPGARVPEVVVGLVALSVVAAVVLGERHRSSSRAETIVLTRRDAILAFAVMGAVATGVVGVQDRPRWRAGGLGAGAGLTASEVETMLAAAAVVLPSAVSVEPGFVTAYVTRTGDRRIAGLRDALALLDREARETYGRRFSALRVAKRDRLLRDLGVNSVPADPDGEGAARLRYYVVDGLLYALFSTPKGTAFLGVENPVGYPGGFDDYQRRPR